MARVTNEIRRIHEKWFYLHEMRVDPEYAYEMQLDV